MATLSKGDQAALKAANDIIARGQAIGDASVVQAGQNAVGKITGVQPTAAPAASAPADAGTGEAAAPGGTTGAPEGYVVYSSGNKSKGTSQIEKELKGLYGDGGSYSTAALALLQANDAATKQAVEELKAQKTETNQSYGDMFRQLYKQKMAARKNIGQVMAAQGVTGGASETTALGLETGYAEALRQGEQERIKSQSELDRAITEAQMTGKMQNAQAVSDLVRERTNSYAGVLQSMLNRQDNWDMHNENMEYQKGRDAAADEWQKKTWDYNVEQDSKNEKLTAQQDARSRIETFLTMGGSVDAVYATFDEATLAAAGLTRGEMEQIAAGLAEQKAAQKVTYTGGGGGTPKVPAGSVYERMYSAGITAPGDVAAYLIDEGYNESEVKTLTGHYTNWIQRNHWDGSIETAEESIKNGNFGTEYGKAYLNVMNMIRDGASDEEIGEFLDENYTEVGLTNSGLEFLFYEVASARNRARQKGS